MTKGKHTISIMDIFKRTFLAFVFVTGIFFLLAEKLLPSDIPDNDYVCTKYQGEWVQVKEDGTRVPISAPGRCEGERGDVIKVETKITFTPERNRCLCFRSSKQEMWIYVDGELRQSYTTEADRMFGKTGPVVYVFMDLLPGDAGKTITVVTQSDSSYSGMMYTVYYGNRMGVWHHFVGQYGLELIVAFFTLFLGAISVLISIVLRIAYREKVDLVYLGWGVVLSGTWLVTNSVFRQLFFPNMSVVNAITFCMIMLIPIPFLIYLDGMQRERYHIPYMIMIAADLLMFVVCTTLHMTGIKDFADTIHYIAVTSLFSILMMAATMIIDICRHRVHEYLLSAIGVLGAAIAACVQIIIYFRRTVQFSGVILAFGLIFLLLISVIGTVRDILNIEGSKQQAILANEAKARFLANMSHEIRTPINAVLGMDAMILREKDQTKIKEYAVDIQNAGQTLLALINDILDMSKIESGKLEILPVEYDLSSMLHDVVNMISMKMHDKDLKFEVFVNQQLPAQLLGDEIRIRQVLINILNNAVKYTERGSVTFTVGGEVQGDKALLRFSVKDTGIGIKKEELTKLFAEFERIEETRNRNIEGTGLGMNITATLLEMMGTSLQVDSVYGKGSEFSFELEQPIVNADPIGNLEERIRQMTKEYTYDALFTAPNAQLLMVDDNAINRKVFFGLLKETKVQIDEAESGIECIEKVKQKHYDLIFLDHMMPDMDGIETMHRIRELPGNPCKDTPIIALTANAIAGAMEMYISEGFDEFLSKPIVPDKLEAMIQRLLPQELVTYETDAGKPDMTAQDIQKAAETVAEELPDVEGIDWDYALLHLHDRNLLLGTVRDFYRMLDSEADYVQSCYDKLFINKDETAEEETMNLYRVKVHAMKGSAAMIGAMQLFGLAKTLEYAARDGRRSVMESLTPVFLEDWRSYKERLKVCMPEQGAKTVVEDYGEILEYLEKLKPAMEELDIDIADETMEALMLYRYPDEIEAGMEKLGAAVTELDSEKAEHLIDDLIKRIKVMSGIE